MTAFQPRLALRDRVAAIDLVQQDGSEVRVLPSPSAVLGFQLDGRVRSGETLLSPAGITGIQKQARQYGYVGATTSLLVRFTAQGAACLGVPASELTGQSLSLEELLPAANVRRTREQLHEALTDVERVAVLEAFLLTLPFAHDPVVERALAMLSTGADDDARVAVVARSLALSERQLERRFLSRVGITPKRFASLRRFERAVQLARSAPSLTQVALDAGYYDQSHFIRDFQRFAGAPPGTVLRKTT